MRIDGVRGEPSPPETKVCINYSGGFRNSMTFVLAGLDIDRKAKMTVDALLAKLGGADRFETFDVQLIESGAEDPATNEQAFSYLRVTVKDRDRNKVGRAFSNACIELGLGGYPGFFTTTPPQPETEYTVYWPTLVPAEVIDEVVVRARRRARSRSRRSAAAARGRSSRAASPDAACRTGRRSGSPLGRVAGARSGDKGGNANCGVWARRTWATRGCGEFLTVARLRELLPEARELEIDRYELPNLRALNFVLKGFLGEGVMSSTRMDPQAKSLGGVPAREGRRRPGRPARRLMETYGAGESGPAQRRRGTRGSRRRVPRSSSSAARARDPAASR